MPDTICSVAHEVWGQPRYRENAGRVQAEMSSLPGLEHAITLLAKLVVEHKSLGALA